MNKSITKVTPGNWYDYVGIASSGICFIHCVLPPLLMLFNIGLAETPLFNYFFLFISLIAVFNSTRYHRQRGFLAWLWTAFILTVLGVLFEDYFPRLEYLVYFSTLALIGGHIWNIHHNRRCKACE